jgi:hypothetical protein
MAALVQLLLPRQGVVVAVEQLLLAQLEAQAVTVVMELHQASAVLPSLTLAAVAVVVKPIQAAVLGLAVQVVAVRVRKVVMAHRELQILVAVVAAVVMLLPVFQVLLAMAVLA